MRGSNVQNTNYNTKISKYFKKKHLSNNINTILNKLNKFKTF